MIDPLAKPVSSSEVIADSQQATDSLWRGGEGKNDDDKPWLRVAQRSMAAHQSKAGNTVLRVRYVTEAAQYFEYLTLEQPGKARHFAEQKWKCLGGRMPAPMTVAEAIDRRNELGSRLEIQLSLANNGYFNVVGVRVAVAEAPRLKVV